MDLVLRAGASVLLLALAGCGGSSTPTSNSPSPTPRPTPPAPAVIAQGSGYQLPVLHLGDISFSTTSVGTVEAVVDWTFSSNDVDVYITRACTFEQFVAEQCTMVAFSESSTAKPERPRATNVQPGAYTLWVGNLGPTDESVSFQVVFSANAAAAAAPGADSAAAPGHPSFAKGKPLGRVLLR